MTTLTIQVWNYISVCTWQSCHFSTISTEHKLILLKEKSCNTSKWEAESQTRPEKKNISQWCERKNLIVCIPENTCFNPLTSYTLIKGLCNQYVSFLGEEKHHIYRRNNFYLDSLTLFLTSDIFLRLQFIFPHLYFTAYAYIEGCKRKWHFTSMQQLARHFTCITLELGGNQVQHWV